MTRDYVTEQNIKDDFNDFLSARGINITDKVKDNTEGNKSEIISMKGIMNFYANVSSFIASRLIYVVDSYGHGPVLFYNHNSGISYSNVTFDSIIDKNHPDFTSSEIETCTNNLLDSLTNTTKVYNVNVVLNYYSSCCSSSSSSSSSSSCSSSSSSSSWFIAYMDI